MRVAREEFTVFADAAEGEVNLVIASLRLAFTREEARRLADRISEAAAAAEPERAALPAPTAFGFEAKDLLALTQAIAGLRQSASPPAEITVEPKAAIERAGGEKPMLETTVIEERRPNGRLRNLLKVLGKDGDAVPKRA